MTHDVYFKKMVSLEQNRQVLQFRVSQDLFSSHQVDIGTRRLLRTLASANAGAFRKILDLGCGYGPIGLTLKQSDETRIVHMVDRDALAVEYSRQNAALNRLPGVEICGSLGYDDVLATDFDLVASNIPGKAGKPVISYLLRDACYYLRPGGLVAIVAVAPLESTVAEILDHLTIEVVFREARSGHAVFHYRFSGDAGEAARPGGTAVERGVYHRQEITVSFRGLEFPMQTAYGLPEFDAPSYRSELLIEGMQAIQGSAVRRAIVFNPGQGHVPVALWKLFEPNAIVLVDRDLLSLRYSQRNLHLNECPGNRVVLSHQVGTLSQGQEPVDLVVGILREAEGAASVALTVQQAADQLVPGGAILAAGSSTGVTRLSKALRSEKRLRIEGRKRHKGRSLLVLRRR